MAVRKLLYISSGGYTAEHENADSIQLGAIGIGGAPDATGIKLAVGDITLTGSAGIDLTGSTGTITGLPSSPSTGSEATSKTYVDSLISGGQWKPPVITMELISDALATAPGSPASGDSYVTAGVGTVNITAVNTTTETFTVAEDKSGLGAGDIILVEGSTGNDGYYTVVSTSGSGPTDITVSEDVTDSTADGTIDHCTPGDTWDTIGPKKIVCYDGSSWDVVQAGATVGLQTGDRVVAKQTGVAGSFTGHENDIATWGGSSWSFEDPESGWAVLVQDYNNACYWDNQGFTFDSATPDWIQFTGLGQVVAGDGLTKSGNVLDVGAGNGISVAADSVAVDPGNAIGVDGTGVYVDITNATDGTALTLANDDEFLFADTSDSSAVKKTTIAKIQDAIAAENGDLTDGNGIVDFTYDGSSAATITVEAADNSIDVGVSGISVGFSATVPGLETADGGIRISTGAAGNALTGGGGAALAVDVNGATDGSALTLANDDEILFADTSDTNATKKTTIAKLQDAIAAENADLTDGNGIVDFTYDGSSAATITVEAVSADRITVGASGIDVAGLPSLFKIAGTAVSANVTAANLDTLTSGVAAGTFNDATSLHAHARILDEYNADTNGVTANHAVRVTSANAIEDGESDSEAGARIIGVSLDTATVGNPARVITHGLAPGVLSGATAGAPYYVDADGALTGTIESSTSRRVIRMGYALNTTDLFIDIMDLGRRAAA